MNNPVLFEEKQVRRVWNEAAQKWYFAIVDVVGVLTDSVNPGAYWRKLKERLKKEGNETVTNCHAFKMTAADGKQRLTDVADAEQLLRLIQSVPSPKAEPFKRWLAKVGYERLQEIENPERAARRMREIYRQKGYSEAWIEKRMRGIAVRDELTDEWKKRGVKEQVEYSILTAEISKATFGMTPTEYRDFKALSHTGDNLRDHMTDLELIFTMLGEASTTEIARNTDAEGFPENRKAARAGGKVAGNARKELEKKSGRKISTRTNYKELPENRRRMERSSGEES
ncbi:MAG: Bro-N domain-containing protein [Kiritimatiellales bacterium]|nr:Bro-N domain-containing protein [Kiritimatiellales bacterium]MCF7863249.1 Bro-N domain-containing protein [Kiritimatiellales bacterium]